LGSPLKSRTLAASGLLGVASFISRGFALIFAHGFRGPLQSL